MQQEFSKKHVRWKNIKTAFIFRVHNLALATTSLSMYLVKDWGIDSPVVFNSSISLRILKIQLLAVSTHDS